MNDDLDNIDALFRLPLAEFTGARNTLAAQLKKSGRGDDATLVKALVKPPVSAWAVNQLYWNHREAFDGLLASGERFHKAQTSGKIADMRTALDARSKALTHLSNLATSLLRDAEHNPSLDTLRRVTTTLEALSVCASRPNAPRPGRLTHDVDPPGFESMASFVPSIRSTSPATARAPDLTPRNARPKGVQDVREVAVTRKAKITAAKVSLHDAKRALAQARASAQGLELTQKKAEAEAKKTVKLKLSAEEKLEKAKAASEAAARQARSVAVELEDATKAMDAAERTVEKLSKALETLSRQS